MRHGFYPYVLYFPEAIKSNFHFHFNYSLLRLFGIFLSPLGFFDPSDFGVFFSDFFLGVSVGSGMNLFVVSELVLGIFIGIF